VFTVALAGATWAVRHWRVEGGSPFLFATGLATVLLSPRCRLGVRGGGPATAPRPIRASAVGVLVASVSLGPDDG
jgi:hypothetical protein